MYNALLIGVYYGLNMWQLICVFQAGFECVGEDVLLLGVDGDGFDAVSVGISGWRTCGDAGGTGLFGKVSSWRGKAMCLTVFGLIFTEWTCDTLCIA